MILAILRCDAAKGDRPGGIYQAHTGSDEKAGSLRLAKRGPLAWQRAQLDGPALSTSTGADYVNRLTVHAVDDSTNRVYVAAVRAFLQDAKRCHLVFSDLSDIDKAMAAYMSDMCFLQLAGPAAGSNRRASPACCSESRARLLYPSGACQGEPKASQESVTASMLI